MVAQGTISIPMGRISMPLHVVGSVLVLKFMLEIYIIANSCHTATSSTANQVVLGRKM